MDFIELNNFIMKLSNNFEIFVSDNLKKRDIQLEKFKSIIDARSLAFFCLGKKNLCINKNISLLIDSNELSNTLTAITESRYQQQKLIVISIGGHIQKESFIDVTSEIVISNNIQEIENKIEMYIKNMYFKPLLVNIEIDLPKKEDKSEIIEYLVKEIGENGKICTNISYDNHNDKVITWENNYGVISRYLGNVVADKISDLYLVTDYNSFCNDINAFYIRYINDRVKVIYLRNGKEELRNDLSKWAKENNINFITVKEDNIDDLKLENINTQTIIEILI